MNFLNYIVWDPSPEIFSPFGWHVRWYGLLFALGFLISQQIMFYIYRQEGKPEKDVETLTFFMVIATVIGARLGHVLFYEPEKYLSNPIDILKIWEGGLASHGAAFGILAALYLYVNYLVRIDFNKFEVKKQKRPGQSYLWVVDRIVIVVALTGALIRFGNFMNSEIVGKQTESDYGVVFARSAEEILDYAAKGYVTEVEAAKVKEVVEGYQYPVRLDLTFARNLTEEDARKVMENVIEPTLTGSKRIAEDVVVPANKEINYQLSQQRGLFHAVVYTEGIPRHPAQLYESASSLLIFFFLFLIWRKYKNETPEGLLLGIFLIILFGLRFTYEFFKENQVEFEDELTLNMGQILSIPLILAGVFILIRSLKHKPKKKTLTTSGS